MGSSARSPRYRWQEGRETDLREYVDNRVREGVSITQALKEYGEKNKMSWLTARWKYYQVRTRKAAAKGNAGTAGQAAASGPAASAAAEARGDDFIGYLQDLVLATEESGQDIIPFIKGFSRMAVLSKESMRLREDAAGLRERLKSARDGIEEHCRHLREWLGRNQVERVSCLKEFSGLMERDLSAMENLCDKLAAES